MRVFLVVLLSLLAAHGAPPSPSVDVAGHWKAVLSIDKTELHLLFRIKKTEEGRLVGMLDSIDQGAHNLPIDKVSLEGNMLRLNLDFIKGRFEGNVDSSSKTIPGVWRQAGKSHPMTLERTTGKEPFGPESLSSTDLAASKQAAQKLGGEWEGLITSGQTKIPLALTVRKNSQGAAASLLDSPEQGLKGIPLTKFTYKDGKIHFEAGGLGASFDGVSFNGNTMVTGQWHQASSVLPLSFKKAATAK